MLQLNSHIKLQRRFLHMDNDELLQALTSVIDSKLQPLKDDITAIKIYQENDISKKFGVLFDGHQLLADKLSRIDDIADDIEDLKGAMVAVELIAKQKI